MRLLGVVRSARLIFIACLHDEQVGFIISISFFRVENVFVQHPPGMEVSKIARVITRDNEHGHAGRTLIN